MNRDVSRKREVVGTMAGSGRARQSPLFLLIPLAVSWGRGDWSTMIIIR